MVFDILLTLQELSKIRMRAFVVATAEHIFPLRVA